LKYPVTLAVNGREHRVEVEARTLLVDLLRDELGLGGVRIGCETGSCNACTVLLDGKAVKSCNVLALQVDGRRVTTIEGLGRVAGVGTAEGSRRLPQESEPLHAIQRAFLEQGATACGFCAAGALLAAKDILDRPLDPALVEVSLALRGHVCRCTGYGGLLEAVQSVPRAAGGGPSSRTET